MQDLEQGGAIDEEHPNPPQAPVIPPSKKGESEGPPPENYRKCSVLKCIFIAIW